MKSEWYVLNNPAAGDTPYIAARVRDTSQVTHSGNLEYHGGYMADKATVQKICDELNSEIEQEGENERE